MPGRIILTRHGQSRANEEDRIGGNAPLTHKGWDWAGTLCNRYHEDTVEIWTSTKRRTLQTASLLASRTRIRPRALRALDELDAGDCEDLCYSEVPTELKAARAADKIRFRYPRGESYVDLCHRVAPVLEELKHWRVGRADGLLVVICHRAVLRCLLQLSSTSPCPTEGGFVSHPVPLEEVFELGSWNPVSPDPVE